MQRIRDSSDASVLTWAHSFLRRGIPGGRSESGRSPTFFYEEVNTR